jgi:hypothetical protein
LEHKNSKKQLEALSPGDLIKVEWTDASIGKSLGSGVAVDVPVNSWGIFIGVLGEKSKHIILGQNDFRYADGLYDIDYTAIPAAWTINIRVIEKNHISAEEAKVLLNSFLIGGRRTLPKRKRQKRVVNHHG